MRAFVLESVDAPPALRDDLPAPTPTDEQVLVRVRSSSVNPVDVFIASGALAQGVEHEFPVVLGRDFAGVVERVGADVTRFRDGDEVFGFLTHANPTVRDGSWCELIVVPETDSAWERPRNVGLPEAGAAPLAAITALAALDALALEPGETVLAVGATGGVGSFFVQLAAAAGAHVIATALARGPRLPGGARSRRAGRPLRRRPGSGAGGPSRRGGCAPRSRHAGAGHLRPRRGGPRRLAARRRRRGAGTVQRDGAPDAGEPLAPRSTARRRHAPRPDPAQPTTSPMPERHCRR